MSDSDFLDALRVLRAEVGRLKAQLENLYSEDPCPHCGCGVSAQCYGCLWKKAEAEVERLRAENVEWQDRALADQTARGEAEAKRADAHCLLQSAAAAIDPETWPDISAQLDAALESCELPQCKHASEAFDARDKAEAKLAKVVEAIRPITSYPHQTHHGVHYRDTCPQCLAEAALAAAQEEPKPGP